MASDAQEKAQRSQAARRATAAEIAGLTLLLVAALGVSWKSGFLNLDQIKLPLASESVMQEAQTPMVGTSLNLDELVSKSASKDPDASLLLAVFHGLNFLAQSDPKSDSVNSANAAKSLIEANKYFLAATSQASDSCEPPLLHALVKLSSNEIDEAIRLLEQVNQFPDSECKAHRDVYMGIIAEASQQDNEKARELYRRARETSEHVFENFFDRDYTATNPAHVPIAFLGWRLRKLAAFRALFRTFFRLRDSPEALDFGMKPFEEGGVHIRGGTNNLDQAKAHFAEHGYVVLRGFLTPWETRLIQSFYAQLIDAKVIDNFDPNLARTVTYNDRLSHWLGQSFTEVMTEIGGRPLKHVYSFLCWHQPQEGSGRPRLIPHTDREDNDYTVSIQMHYDDATGETAWPLWVHGVKQPIAKAGWQPKPPLDQSVQLRLSDGDALVFRGRSYIHWRDDMPESGRSFSSLLLHFVHKEWDWVDFKNVRQRDDPAI